MVPADCSITWRVSGISRLGGTGTSTTARAQPCDSFRTFSSDPLRRCQTTPFSSRSRVVRKLTALGGEDVNHPVGVTCAAA
jgi:hypothetical protein